ncbi:MAG: methyl-accepting chemotaxis protein, partial [Thermoguttaceae bacterium]
TTFDEMLKSFDDSVNDYNEVDRLIRSVYDESLKLDASLAKISGDANLLFTTSKDNAKSNESISAKILVVSTICAVILGTILCTWISRDITSGIKRIVTNMLHVAKEGDVELQLHQADLMRKDEVGQMVRSFGEILAEIKELTSVAAALGDGNWCVQINVRGEKDAMNLALAKMVEQVKEILNAFAKNVAAVNEGATRVAQASESLSQGASESAASVEEISATMTEIGRQTNDNAKNADQANSLAKQTSDSAVNGQEMMKKMITAMEQITKNSQEVQKVVKVIDDISFQTNLLALNAAVEAARAGSHGKGFAVVAEEVRNLASRSAKAAAETTQMIDNSSKQIAAGAGIASQTSDMLNEIVSQATQVASLIASIASASTEQASGVKEVSHGLHQIESVTQQNTASAEQTAGISAEMNNKTVELQKLIGQFRI